MCVHLSVLSCHSSLHSSRVSAESSVSLQLLGFWKHNARQSFVSLCMGHERGELSGSPRPASPPFLPVLYFCCHFVIWLPSVALKGVAGGVLFIRSLLLISPSPSCLVHPPSDSSALVIHTGSVLRCSGSASTANSSIAKACPNCLLFIGGLQDLERAH